MRSLARFHSPPRPAELNVDVVRQVLELFAARAATPEGEPDLAAVRELARFATVSPAWHDEAVRVLWRDLSPALVHDGSFVPRVLESLRSSPLLATSVRRLHITASLEGALWQSAMSNEGDVFAAIVRACPNLSDVVVPTFEAASRCNVLDALSSTKEMRSFTIRVYLESSRRSSRFSNLIPYFDWDMETLCQLFAYWPKLQSFVVKHVPLCAYHMKPDVVFAPPERNMICLPPSSSPLTRLELRETFINDYGLFHLLGQNSLTELVLMSCQGITSSAISKAGLFQAITQNGATLKRLEVMTPWLPSDGSPKLVLDEALRSCTALESLTVAGWDVSDSFFSCLPSTLRLRQLGLTDFEAITPAGILSALTRRSCLKSLEKLAIWQRNGGISPNGQRIATGWFGALFEKHRGPLADALAAKGIRVGTGWESSLLSGGSVEYYACAPPAMRNASTTMAWAPPSR